MKLVFTYPICGGRAVQTWILPEDEILRRTLQRAIESVLSEQAEPAAEAETEDELCQTDMPVLLENEAEEEPLCQMPALEPAALMEEETAEAEAEPERKEKRYTGFLLIHCEGCGKDVATCLRTPTATWRCRSCGRETPLRSLRSAHFQCSSCGKTWKYRTNHQDACLLTACPACGAEMSSWWHEKKAIYRSF